ncbi:MULTISPECIES: acetyl-CoA carboxylase biotin carboxylase subunit family protein [Exiguobacterium]|uniref:ATP-grasp domain-containing protein n=1 Tax=Exiguobacterium TaxID=33986 RepID=UPI001F19EAE3|nr:MULTISPECIES: carbamoyl-phosphate-synthetase [Exiguobacterium]
MLKLMLLGGAMHQVPIIQKAKQQGIFTVLCDYLPDNPGRLVADRYYCTSTLDREAVLAIAREEGIDGIVAYASDPAARTAAYVGEALGLVTNSLETVETLTNKAKFRTFLQRYDFAVPEAFAFTELEIAVETLRNRAGEYIIKPADASGSKGVNKWSQGNGIEQLRRHLQSAFTMSFNQEVVVEEFITRDGYQLAGDGFVVDGELVFRCFGNGHFNVNGINPFAPISASFPSVHPPHVLEQVHETLQRMLTEVGFKQGAFNFDIFVKGEDVYLMDIGPRNGGNYIPQIIEQATGVDLVQATIDVALGMPVTLEMKPVTVPSAYFIIGSQEKGQFMGVHFDEDACTIRQANIYYNVGDVVPRFEGANQALGSLILEFEDVETMLRLVEHPERWLTLHIQSTEETEGESWTSSSPVRTVF